MASLRAPKGNTMSTEQPTWKNKLYRGLHILLTPYALAHPPPGGRILYSTKGAGSEIPHCGVLSAFRWLYPTVL